MAGKNNYNCLKDRLVKDFRKKRQKDGFIATQFFLTGIKKIKVSSSKLMERLLQA